MMLLAAALLVALVAIALAGLAMRQSRPARRDLEQARARLARIDDDLPKPDTTPPASVDAKALRRDVRLSFDASVIRHDRALMEHLLVDFRDVTGAEEAIFWRWNADPAHESLTPAFWSSE